MQQFTLRPSNIVAPNFQAILDGVICNIVITWNISRQGYYINIYGNTGSLIVAEALVESDDGILLNNLSWSQGIAIATLSIAQPWRKVGQIVEWTLSNCKPDAYNGTYKCLMLSPLTFSFPLSPNPGQPVVMGLAERRFDMIGPWFKTSSMFYRNGIFQVDP